MERRLAPLAIEIGGLLTEESVDVGIASVHVGAAGGHEGLEPGRRIAECRARAQDEVLELLLELSFVVRRSLEGPELHANAAGLKIIDHGLGDPRMDGVARELPGVESVR